MTPEEELFTCQVCQSRKEIFAMLNTMSRARGEASFEALKALGPRSPEFICLDQIRQAIDLIQQMLVMGARDCEGDEKPAMPVGDDGFWDTSNFAELN